MDTTNKISNITRDDLAFFNSVLSYGIYTNREWMLGLNEFGHSQEAKSFDDIVTEAAFELYKSDAHPKELMKRNYELYISAYIKNNFQKFSLHENSNIEYTSDKYGYQTQCQFQESDYFSLNNLARAGYFLSQNSDGTQNLHLVFRGTDNKARDFMEFVGKAYLDMSAYYDAFKPLEEKILAFAKDPKNNIKTVQVSGHSLGGAMVQEFFNSPHVQNSGLNMVGFTYGAPGTDKKPLHIVATETFHNIKRALKTKKFSSFCDVASNTLSPLVNNFIPSTLYFGNMLTVTAFGFDFSEAMPGLNIPSKKLDSRIFQYEHTGDLIPKLGAAAYNESGQEIYLKDIASKNAKDVFMLTGRSEQKQKHKFFAFMSQTFNWLIKRPIGFVKSMFQFEYHDMMRYVINIEHKIITEHHKENTPYYNDFLSYKQRFTKHTTNKNSDLIYQRLLDKLGVNSEDKTAQMKYIRISPALQEKMNQASYLLTTKNVVSDILGKPVAYDIQNFGWNKENKAKANISIKHEITDMAKNLASKEQPDFTGNSQESINNILNLRKKFLENSQTKNDLTI